MRFFKNLIPIKYLYENVLHFIFLKLGYPSTKNGNLGTKSKQILFEFYWWKFVSSFKKGKTLSFLKSISRRKFVSIFKETLKVIFFKEK